MTDAGNQLLTQAAANGTGVVIDNLVISNNKPQGDLSITDKSFFNAKIPINSKNSQGNTLQVEAVLNNDDYATDYAVNAIGVTAHIQNDNNSVLLAIAVADEPEVIPASADIKYTQYFDFSITNDKQANITAEINPAGIVSNDAFNHAINSLSANDINNISSLSNELSSYATQSEMSNYATNSDLNSYATTNSINTELSNYVNNSSFNSSINSLSTTDSNNISSLSNTFSRYASNDSVHSEFNSVNAQFSNYATNSALSSLISQIPSSTNFSGYATISSVDTQIASTESYANSVATSTVSASAVIDNHNNTVMINGQTRNIMAVYSVNTDANTLTTPGTVLLQANLNHTNVPLNANWDYVIHTISEGNNNLFQIAWSSGYASYWQRTYWNNNGNWEWAPWYTMATTNDANNAYQNAVNTASSYANTILSSAQSYATSLVNSLQNSAFPILPSWIPSGAIQLPIGSNMTNPAADNTWYYIKPNDITYNKYIGLPYGQYTLDPSQWYAIYKYGGTAAQFNGKNYSQWAVYIFNQNGPYTETYVNGNSYTWSNVF